MLLDPVQLWARLRMQMPPNNGREPMTDQPSLFDRPELLPDLPGMIQGVVGMREGAGKHGRNEYDLQCQDCLSVETVDYLVLMRYQFPPCQSPRRRLCPDCHKQICDGYGRCRGLPGMPGFYD